MLCASLSKSPKKAIKHEPRRLAHVVPVLKFAEVLRQIFAGNMNMRAPNGPFDLRPEAFDGVRVMDTVDPLLDAVVDRAVLIREPAEATIPASFIRADR